MSFLSKLFGQQAKGGEGAVPSDVLPLSTEVEALLRKGLGIIDSCVKYEAGARLSSTEAVQAAKVFEQAAALAPDHPLPEYLAICAHAIGLQGKTADTMLKTFVPRFPNFYPAQIMQGSWEASAFSYPPYKTGDPLPPIIDRKVSQTTVVLVREEYAVHPVLISRCAPSTLSRPLPPATPVALHPLIVKTPVGPIGVAIAVIGDDPADPLRLEALLPPFEGTGDECHHSPAIRYMLRSPRTPIVLIDPNSRILLATEARIPIDRLKQMGGMERDFLNVKPAILEPSQIRAAIQHYQAKISMSQFGLD